MKLGGQYHRNLHSTGGGEKISQSGGGSGIAQPAGGGTTLIDVGGGNLIEDHPDNYGMMLSQTLVGGAVDFSYYGDGIVGNRGRSRSRSEADSNLHEKLSSALGDYSLENPLNTTQNCCPIPVVARTLTAGWEVALVEPTPYGEIVMGAVTTAAILYYGPDLAKKMAKEIEGILQRSSGPPGILYELRATRNGLYPNLNTGKTTYLNVGDVWKYGETTIANRYSEGYLKSMGLYMYPIYYGNQMEIKVQEKIMIYGYYFQHGHRPPGNKIFR